MAIKGRMPEEIAWKGKCLLLALSGLQRGKITFYEMSTLSDVLCLQPNDPCPYLDVSAGVDFVNSISRGSACLPVQVVALNKHCVITEASHPHISLALTLQLNPFANVKPGGEDRGQ